ncbi:hypothetical protein AAC387_Pa07g0369 [Persea americana]
MLLCVLLVFEVATLFGQGDEVGEDHSTKADMVDRVDGARLDVLCVVIVHGLRDGLLYVVDRKHRLNVGRQILHLHSLYLVVEAPHRHLLSYLVVARYREMKKNKILKFLKKS